MSLHTDSPSVSVNPSSKGPQRRNRRWSRRRRRRRGSMGRWDRARRSRNLPLRTVPRVNDVWLRSAQDRTLYLDSRIMKSVWPDIHMSRRVWLSFVPVESPTRWPLPTTCITLSSFVIDACKLSNCCMMVTLIPPWFGIVEEYVYTHPSH